MAKVVSIIDEKHTEAQYLLPWYLTGRLDAAARARVDSHLAVCAECRADLVEERRLMVEWAVLPIEAEHSWLRLRERSKQYHIFLGISVELLTYIVDAKYLAF